MSGVARVWDFLRSFEMRQTEESGWERFHRTGLVLPEHWQQLQHNSPHSQTRGETAN